MADNVTFQSSTPATPAEGVIVSSDQDSGDGSQIQRVKLSYSANGISTHVQADADGLQVNLGANNDVTVTGSVTASAGTDLNTSALALEAGNLASIKTAVEVLDNFISANRGLVTEDNSAAIKTAVETIDNAIAGTEMQVDVVTMPSITGTVTANLAAGTNNIGDVDILTIAAGDNNIGNMDIVTVPAPLSTAGGGTEAAALRVTLANDSTGVVSVDDNGGSLTVDGAVSVSGTVAVTQSGTWDEVGVNDSGNSLTVDAPVATPVFVRLSDGSAAITTLPVSVESVPSHAVTNAGTFATQESGALLTSAQLIDDGIATVGSAIPTKGMAAAGTDGTNARILKTDASGELQVDVLTLPNVTIGAAVPAGTNNIGDVDILTIAAGDNNIGNVDVLTIAAGDNNIGNVDIVTVPAPLSTTGNGTAASALRVSLASDSTGVVGLAAGTNGIGKLTANSGVTIGAVELAAAQTLATVTTLTGGGVAHDSPDGGNPVKVGAKASATLSDDTMVANADRTDLTSDLDGALYVRNVPLGDIITEAASNTDGASTEFSNFGATASARNYITSITVFRTDTGTTMAYIDIRDGSAGSVLYRIPLPPAGGAVLTNGGAPVLYSSVNTALAFDVSSALSTVYISVTGFKSKARA